MKTLIALVAMTVTAFSVNTTATAATGPHALGGTLIQPDPRAYAVSKPNPRPNPPRWSLVRPSGRWGGVITPNPRGFGLPQY